MAKAKAGWPAGMRHSAEARQKMRAAALGRKLDEETKAKISASHRRRSRLIEQLERDQSDRAA